MNKLHMFSFKTKAFANVVRTLAAILSRPQCVKPVTKVPQGTLCPMESFHYRKLSIGQSTHNILHAYKLITIALRLHLTLIVLNLFSETWIIFLHIKMAQIVEIPPYGGQWPVYPLYLVADGLAMQWARSSATMVLTLLSLNIFLFQCQKS